MAKPKVLGIEYAAKAEPVRAAWRETAVAGHGKEQRLAKAKLKSLATFETRVAANPLTAGNPVQHNRWPRALVPDYGKSIPNLFRFELAERWRGYYALIGEPGGCRVWVLYLWDHEENSRQSGYAKR